MRVSVSRRSGTPRLARRAAGVGLPLALWLARSITRPLDRLAAAARTVAAGDLPTPLKVDGPREVARVTESFNAMSAEVAASRQVVAQLLANLRHDLGTPLTVIAGFAQALLDGTAHDGDARRAAARTIADETRRLEAMVEDLAKLADPPSSPGD